MIILFYEWKVLSLPIINAKVHSQLVTISTAFTLFRNGYSAPRCTSAACGETVTLKGMIRRVIGKDQLCQAIHAS